MAFHFDMGVFLASIDFQLTVSVDLAPTVKKEIFVEIGNIAGRSERRLADIFIANGIKDVVYATVFKMVRRGQGATELIDGVSETCFGGVTICTGISSVACSSLLPSS